MRKRLFAVCACLALLCAALPARAEDFTLDAGLGPVLICGSDDSPGRVDITNGATAYKGVDPASARILIRGAGSVDKAAEASHIQLQNVPGTLSVTLQGVSVADRADDTWGPMSILYCEDVRLTLEGDSTLALTSGDMAALDVGASRVRVSGSGALAARGGSPANAAGGAAMSVTDGSSVTLEGGRLALLGGNGGNSNTAFGGDALFCADSAFSVTGGSLTAQGGVGGTILDTESDFYYVSGGCGVSMAMLSGTAGLSVSGGQAVLIGGVGGLLADGTPSESGFAFVGAALTLDGGYAEAGARQVLAGATAEDAAAWDETTSLDASLGTAWGYIAISGK